MAGTTGVARTGRLALVLLALVVVWVALAPPAAAETTISVRATSGDSYIPNRHVTLRVQIVADRLIEGTIHVGPSVGPGFRSSGSSGVSVPVQVAGGSTKEIEVVVPVADEGMGRAIDDQLRASTELVVQLLEGTSIVAERRVSLSFDETDEVVGVLPGLVAANGSLPDRVRFRMDAGDAHLVALAPESITSAAKLDAFHTIAAAPSDLTALTRDQASALGAWLVSGGHLLVDTKPGVRIEGLPDAWQPTNGWAFAGSGDVRTTAGRLAAGGWDDALDPAGTGSASALMQGWMGGGPTSVAGDLGHDIGLRVPELGVLFVILGAYAVLAGPVLFFVLKRKDKLAAAWVIVPVMSLVLCVGLIVVGSRVRPADRSAHITVIESGDWGSYATSTALVSASSAGSRVAMLPRGWVPDETTAVTYDSLEAENAQQRPDGLAFPIDFDSGESVLVQASGPSTEKGGLEIDATVEGDGITGTVRNTTSYALRDVVVVTQNRSTTLPAVAAGQEVTFDLSLPSEPAPGRDARPELTSWSGCSSCLASSAGWSAYLDGRGRALHDSGVVFAVGWTDAATASMTVDGQPVSGGRTAIVSRARLTARSSTATAASRQTIARASTDGGNGGGIGGGALFDHPMVRLVLPPSVTPADVDAGRVVLVGNRLAGAMQVEVDGRFQPAVTEKGRLVVRPDMVHDGVVYVVVDAWQTNGSVNDALTIGLEVDEAGAP